MERQCIEQELRLGTSWRKIGLLLKREASTILREVRRNRCGRMYRHLRADARALERRSKPRRVRRLLDGRMCRRVERLLRIGWEPRLVARSLRVCGSASTLYRAARGAKAAQWGRLLTLPSKAERLRSARRERIHRCVNIGRRAAHVANRRQAGHWEGDTIRPTAGSQTGLLVLVERKTRLVRIALLRDRSAATLNRAATRLLKGYPVRSLTVDNGMEFASHEALRERIGAPVYFCNPHSPWERGTNEQTNKLIRYFIPRGTDIAGYSTAYVRRVQRLLNQRPRRVLNDLTPEQAMSKVLSAKRCT